MVCNLREFKEFIDNEMIVILGQMDSPTEIFDHVFLVRISPGSRVSASSPPSPPLLSSLSSSPHSYIRPSKHGMVADSVVCVPPGVRVECIQPGGAAEQRV